MPVPSAPSWGQRATTARIRRETRACRIRELLTDAGWCADDSIGRGVERMALPDREELIRLLEADAVGDDR